LFVLVAHLPFSLCQTGALLKCVVQPSFEEKIAQKQ
jgi:hypothetical protein